MFKWLKSILWDNRNEPFLVLIGSGLLIIVAYQTFVRQLPLAVSKDIVILPSSESDPIKVPQSSLVPVGTIVAYFGKDDDIPPGWALCDGRDNPNESKITIDANSNEGGIQLPDLRNRFIRGSNQALAESHVKEGGNDTITLEHAHLWAHFKSKKWYSYNENNQYQYYRIDNWDDGVGDKGENNFPLQVDEESEKKLYTEMNTINVSNLPKYIELRFIIRIF